MDAVILADARLVDVMNRTVEKIDASINRWTRQAFTHSDGCHRSQSGQKATAYGGLVGGKTHVSHLLGMRRLKGSPVVISSKAKA